MNETFDPYASCVEPPHDVVAELRGRCPVAETPSGWFVTTYDGVRQVLQRVDAYTGSFIDADGFPEDERSLMNVEEPEHGRLRKVINGAIAGHRTAGMEPFIRDLATATVDDLLARAERDGSVDVVEHFAAVIPVRVIARALGVPVDDFGRFQRWADELVERLYDRPPAPYSTLHPEFAGYLQDLIELRRSAAEPARDFTTRLMEAGLSDAAVRTHAMHLIIAGNETTRSMIGNICQRFATRPELFAALRADLSLVPALVEESLRFDSPIQVMGRATAADEELGDVVVPAGSHVVVGLAAANRDPAVFAEPDEFRLDRDRPKDHVAFGAGPHVCPGAFLARLEGVCAIEELVRRVGAIEAVDPEAFDGNPLFWSRAPLSLELRLTPAEVPA